jgi:hypothetical protein
VWIVCGVFVWGVCVWIVCLGCLFVGCVCVCVIRTVQKGFMLSVSGTRGLQYVTPSGKRRVAKCDLEIRSELKRILYKCCDICEGCIYVTQNVAVSCEYGISDRIYKMSGNYWLTIQLVASRV